MNRYKQYIDRYAGLHSGKDPFTNENNKRRYNNQKGRILFSGSQLTKRFLPFIDHVIKKKGRAITMLDYGSGRAIHNYKRVLDNDITIHEYFKGKLQCYYVYDPAVRDYKVKPPLGMEFDLVCCSDVMEHIPEEFVPVVLSEISNYTKKNGTMIFSISANPARKFFEDGENLHVTCKPLEWWIQAFENYLGDKSFLLQHNDYSRLENEDSDPEGAIIIKYYNSRWIDIWDSESVPNGEPIKLEEGV